MGLRPLEIFHSFGAGIDFRRQNLTSTDVIFWRLKSVPALKGFHYYLASQHGVLEWLGSLSSIDQITSKYKSHHIWKIKTRFIQNNGMV